MTQADQVNTAVILMGNRHCQHCESCTCSGLNTAVVYLCEAVTHITLGFQALQQAVLKWCNCYTYSDFNMSNSWQSLTRTHVNSCFLSQWATGHDTHGEQLFSISMSHRTWHTCIQRFFFISMSHRTWHKFEQLFSISMSHRTWHKCEHLFSISMSHRTWHKCEQLFSISMSHRTWHKCEQLFSISMSHRTWHKCEHLFSISISHRTWCTSLVVFELDS